MDIGNEQGRRHFLKHSAIVAVGTLAGAALLHSCDNLNKNDKPKKASPLEKLMLGHGLFSRVLLIYDACRKHLLKNETFPLEALSGAAAFVRDFIENYYERMQEEFLFPHFQRTDELNNLVQVLQVQHRIGRRITEKIIRLSQLVNISREDIKELITLLASFNTMYRPHDARESTILFPAFREIVSNHELEIVGDRFLEREEKLFGAPYFEVMLARIVKIEKVLGIYDLEQFTPSDV